MYDVHTPTPGVGGCEQHILPHALAYAVHAWCRFRESISHTASHETVSERVTCNTHSRGRSKHHAETDLATGGASSPCRDRCDEPIGRHQHRYEGKSTQHDALLSALIELGSSVLAFPLTLLRIGFHFYSLAFWFPSVNADSLTLLSSAVIHIPDHEAQTYKSSQQAQRTFLLLSYPTFSRKIPVNRTSTG